MCKQYIAVFDSGLGGISVLKQLQKEMPHEHFLYLGDSANAPYGTKQKEEIIDRCIHICDAFIKQNAKAIIVACNTATSVAIQILRDTYPIPIIGLEPALKLATYEKHKQNIIVMATPLTLVEEKFAKLMDSYHGDHNITTIPCPELVSIVENNALQEEVLVYQQLQKYFENLNMNEIHSIVLGCTHFVFYRPYFAKYYSHIQIYDGNQGTTQHVKRTLLQKNQLVTVGEGSVEIHNSTNQKSYLQLSRQLLEKELQLSK